MKVDYRNFKTRNNWVLVKPDENPETYQINGRETGILSPDIVYENGNVITEKQKNASVYGTVYSAPEGIGFYLNEIQSLNRSHTVHKRMQVDGLMKNVLVNFEVQKQIDQYYEMSSNFKVDVEIKFGDRVNFSYMAHEKCLQDGRVFETDLGVMYLIKYDMLYCVVDENLIPTKMLNGFIIAQPEEIEKEKIKVEFQGNTDRNKTIMEVEGTTTDSGLILVSHKKLKKSRKNQLGKILYVGNKCQRYLQQPEAIDSDREFSSGMRIIYDPRGATNLEYFNHQVLSDKTLHLLQRKDVWVTEKDVDLNKVEI